MTLRGTVVDAKTKEPLPFTAIIVKSGSDTVTHTNADLDGNYEVRLPKGKYTITYASISYEKQVLLEDEYTTDTRLPLVLLTSYASVMDGIVVIESDPESDPMIYIGDPNAPTQQMEKDGVKVIVQ